MKKMKPLVLIFLIFLLSVSCADDNEFHNLLGSWYDIPSTGTPGLKLSTSKPPPIDGCAEKINVEFNENLSGSLTLSIEEDGCIESDTIPKLFDWSIKGDELRINFNPGDGNDWNLKGGVHTFSISGDTLTIVNEDASSVVLLRE